MARITLKLGTRTKELSINRVKNIRTRQEQPQLFEEMSSFRTQKMPFSLKPSHLFLETLGTRVFWQAYNLFFKVSDVRRTEQPYSKVNVSETRRMKL